MKKLVRRELRETANSYVSLLYSGNEKSRNSYFNPTYKENILKYLKYTTGLYVTSHLTISSLYNQSQIVASLLMELFDLITIYIIYSSITY